MAAGAEGLFLHASAVAAAGGAMLFLGHSTAGKSTIARKLGTAFPVLADDSVFVARGADGVWRGVDGGFRFAKGWGMAEWTAEVRRCVQAADAVPLRGCFRIHQAAAARIEPMAPAELGKHLMDAAMEIDVQRKYGRIQDLSNPEQMDLQGVLEPRRRWFGQVADIARTCPGWHLWFAKETPLDELRLLIQT